MKVLFGAGGRIWDIAVKNSNAIDYRHAVVIEGMVDVAVEDDDTVVISDGIGARARWRGVFIVGSKGVIGIVASTNKVKSGKIFIVVVGEVRIVINSAGTIG